MKNQKFLFEFDSKMRPQYQKCTKLCSSFRQPFAKTHQKAVDEEQTATAA
jgi:hypothetical protein